MTLSLEAERKKAEETLTLLAAAEAAKQGARGRPDDGAERGREAGGGAGAGQRAARRAEGGLGRGAAAGGAPEPADRAAARAARRAAGAARRRRGQGRGGAGADRERSAQNLNAALARVAVEEKRRAELEAKEKERLAAEAQDLESYRSEFFGRMRAILGEREGVQVVGDRFVFPSEVLFAPGSATLGAAGQAQVARVAQVIREIADQNPAGDQLDPAGRRPYRQDAGQRRQPVPRQLGALRGAGAVGGALHDPGAGAAAGAAGGDRASASSSRSTRATARRRWRRTGGSS